MLLVAMAIVLSLNLSVLASTGDRESISVETFDMAEVNECWGYGTETPLRQLIVYSWSDDHARYLVDDFALLPRSVPIRRHPAGGYVIRFMDREGWVREVRAPVARHTITDFDPESRGRCVLPGVPRKKLSQKKLPP